MGGIRYNIKDIKGNLEIKECNNSVHSYKAHFHNEISLGFVKKGCSNTQVSDGTYNITDGTLLMIPAGMPHKCNPVDCKHWDFGMLYINDEWFEKEFGLTKNKVKFSYRKLNEYLCAEMSELFESTEEKILDIEKESKLLRCVSILNEGQKLTNENAERGIGFDKIRKVEKYLQHNYLQNIRLSELSKIAGVSKYYMIRKFQKKFFLSPHQYLINLRVNYAKKLLRSSREITEIALESGFYDQSHFIKAFKEYTGVTPLQYKANV